MRKGKKFLIIILVIWLSLIATDFTRAHADKPPIFALPLLRYKDGGSTEYFGLGYKVIKYVKLSAESGPELEGVEFGSWFMQFSPPR